MSRLTRRSFLKRAGKAGVGLAAVEAGLTPVWAQTSSPGTRVVIDSARQIAPIDRNIFGSFLEHLGRAIYTGIYDPGSKLADENGFRTDVMKEIRGLGDDPTARSGSGGKRTGTLRS